VKIEQLLALPGADLAKIPRADLVRHLEQYFPFTRPSDAQDATALLAGKLTQNLNPELQAKLAELRKKQAPVSLKRK